MHECQPGRQLVTVITSAAGVEASGQSKNMMALVRPLITRCYPRE